MDKRTTILTSLLMFCASGILIHWGVMGFWAGPLCILLGMAGGAAVNQDEGLVADFPGKETSTQRYNPTDEEEVHLWRVTANEAAPLYAEISAEAMEFLLKNTPPAWTVRAEKVTAFDIPTEAELYNHDDSLFQALASVTAKP